MFAVSCGCVVMIWSMVMVSPLVFGLVLSWLIITSPLSIICDLRMSVTLEICFLVGGLRLSGVLRCWVLMLVSDSTMVSPSKMDF